MSSFNVLDFGAVAGRDGVCAIQNGSAIQRAIDAAHDNNGGVVVVPAGKTFLCGSLQLKSRVTLMLEPGSVLLASPDIAHYKDRTAESLFGKADFGRFWIWADGAEDLTLCGNGTLDGNSGAFTQEVRPENTVAKNPRAQSLVLFGCKHLRINNIALRNCPSWALRPCGCDDVVIEGITIESDIGLVNTDGIDIDCCKRVVVKGCVIRCGDDGICIKTRKEAAALYGSCEHVLISDCIVQSSCAGMKLGTESHADIRNITFSNCIVHDSHRGLAIDGRDDAVIENIVFQNITVHTRLSHPVWWHEGEPIILCPVRRAGGGPPALLRNIFFRNIRIRAERGVYVQGSAERPIENLVFADITLTIAKESEYPADKFDPRPCEPDFAPTGHKGKADGTPWGSLWFHDCPGFFAEHVKGLQIDKMRVNWQGEPDPAYSHAIELHNIKDLTLERFSGGAARPGLAPVHQG